LIPKWRLQRRPTQRNRDVETGDNDPLGSRADILARQFLDVFCGEWMAELEITGNKIWSRIYDLKNLNGTAGIPRRQDDEELPPHITRFAAFEYLLDTIWFNMRSSQLGITCCWPLDPKYCWTSRSREDLVLTRSIRSSHRIPGHWPPLAI